MKYSKIIKTACILLAPLLLFFILVLPYDWLNRTVIVNWLGCGCPTMDEFGNFVSPEFNANDFTSLFWSFVSLFVTIIAVFLSRKIPRNKMWLRILYVLGISIISLMEGSMVHKGMGKAIFAWMLS